MSHDIKKVVPRLVLSITDTKTAKKLSQILEKRHCSMRVQCFCMGTANSELLRYCGLGESERILTFWVMPKQYVHRLFLELDEIIHLNRRGGGIAVSIPMTGLPVNLANYLKEHVVEHLKQQIEEEAHEMSKESAYSMILVTVNQGYSDDVIDTARKVGATGGTVIRGRRRGLEEPSRFWGLPLQEELEILSIITPNEKKSEIMSAISHEYGLHSEARALVMSLPVDEIIGLEN